MTVLAPLVDRQSLGIDTIYRGFVYGSLLLNMAIKDPNNPIPLNQNPFSNSVRITNLNNNNGTFTLRLSLPVNRVGYYETAFDLIDTVQEIGLTDPNPYPTGTAATVNNTSAIPTQPANVTNLEQYIVWIGLIIQLAYSQANPPDFTSMIYIYQDEALFSDGVSTLQIQHIVKYDPVIYLCTNNIIQALTQPAELALC